MGFPLFNKVLTKLRETKLLSLQWNPWGSWHHASTQQEHTGDSVLTCGEGSHFQSWFPHKVTPAPVPGTVLRTLLEPISLEVGSVLSLSSQMEN